MSQVFIKNTTYKDLEKAVTELFSFYEIDLKNKQVIIKPNMLSETPSQSGNCTDPYLVRAVVKEVLKQTSYIWVGDNPSKLHAIGGNENTARINGIYNASLGYYTNVGSNAKVVSIGSEIIDQLPISKHFLEADAIINLPKAKTHILTGITCCIKNMFGTIPGSFKARIHYEAGHVKRFTQFLVDLYKYIKPTFNIVDALTVMEGDGPFNSKIREQSKIIAGFNGLEIDTVISSMMGFNEKKMKILQLANQAGLGEIEMEKIEILGEFSPWPNFEIPSTYTDKAKDTVHAIKATEIHNAWGDAGRFHPYFVQNNCIQCATCAETCPVGAIYLNPYPILDENKCISCFCCSETCPSGARIVSQKEAHELFFRLNPSLQE